MNWALLTSFFVYSWISLSQNQFTWNFDYVRIVSDFVHFDLIYSSFLKIWCVEISDFSK